MKDIGAIKTDKAKNDREQKQNTRSNTRIQALFQARDLAINNYNATWKALIALDFIMDDDEVLPPLTIKDTFWKNPMQRRVLGDSR